MTISVLPQLQKDLEFAKTPERFEEIRDELSVIIPGTALGFTQQALSAEDIDSKQNLLDGLFIDRL